MRRGRRPRRPVYRAPCSRPLRTTRNTPSRADRVVRPRKIMPCRTGPICPAVPPHLLQKARHCEASAHTGCGNPHSLPPGDRKGRPYAPSFHFQLFSFSSFPRKNPPEAAASGGGFLCPISIFPYNATPPISATRHSTSAKGTYTYRPTLYHRAPRVLWLPVLIAVSRSSFFIT